ncbi:MAG TPA: hypothetical protein VM324_12815 [Egibacteraceae bacterium]|nr:hypothetical protein [Egibacteraceae bacterium]
MTTLVGGVGELYQGDLDFGRVVVQRLAGRDLGHDVLVEELHYGAVAVAQRLEDVRPHTLVLVGATPRGRQPGTVERRRIRRLELDPADVQVAVGDAVTGYVGIDLVVEVGWGLGVLPPRTLTIEVEPAPVSGPSEELSPPARAVLDRVCAMVCAEVRRAPVLELADELRARLAGEPAEPSPAVDAMRELLGQLAVLDDEGRWGATFRCRDRLRAAVTGGETGDAMSNVDWALWWTLIEELDRLGAVDAVEDRY